MLVVAPGLPFIKPLDSADWFNDDDYHPVDGDVPLRPKKGGHDLRPHPINEGCYIIDILATRG
ncbi:MAG: hypothetical protein IPM85_05075 [Chitinophagaceae bacterium]|nr:hypothetical protein [Chitinophagaceae bacterium]